MCDTAKNSNIAQNLLNIISSTALEMFNSYFNSEVFAFALVGHPNSSCNWLSKAGAKLALDNLGLAKKC